MDGLNIPFEGISLLLMGFAVLLLLIQLYFILFLHGKLAFYKTGLAVTVGMEAADLPPLSVIISVRNEEQYLTENLPGILDQDYPVFEVIVVNDRSDDDTKWLLRDLSAQYPHLKVVEIAEHVLARTGKKFGVAMGIKAAQYEHLVFTDADCVPSSDRWLRHLGAAFGKHSEGGVKDREATEIVLGYVPLRRKKGLLNALIRFEHFYRSVNYLSYALKRRPYTGLGQNMAYVKDLFFKGKGFAAHIHVSSGYDELFVNQHATRRNTRIAIHREAHVWKPMPRTFGNYKIERKLRWQAVKLFRTGHKSMLDLDALSGLLFYLVLPALLIAEPASWPYVLGLYGLRLLAQYAVYLPVAGKLRITRMLWFLPVLDILHRFYLGLRWR